MKRVVIPGVIILLSAVVAVFAVIWLLGPETAQEGESFPVRDADNEMRTSAVVAAIPDGNREKQGAKRESKRQPIAIVEESEFSPKEQKVADAIQDGLDNEDFSKVVSQMGSVASSTNAVLRMRAVEALRWFTPKSLPELVMFMGDKDDDVRTTAIDAWTTGLSEMDPGKEKAEAVRMGLSVVTDKDQLESMVMQVDDFTDFQKLDVLTSTIEGSNKFAAEVAREHYKFWTEEDYADLATAQRWLDAQMAADAVNDEASEEHVE